MRQAIWIVTGGLLLGMTGCGEFMNSDKLAPASSVDVVGDPSDPVADSSEPSDILAAENLESDQDVAGVDSRSDGIQRDEPSESPNAKPEKQSVSRVKKHESVLLKTTLRNADEVK